MKNFAVVGNPVQHSLSPKLHNEIFRQMKIEGNYDKLEIKERKIPSILKSMRHGDFQGLNVTIPYKEKVLPFLDELSSDAKNIGAVNCITNEDGKLIGHNTDSIGFLHVLKLRHVPIRHHQFVVLGAGGTAKSVVYALLHTVIEKIIVVNRTASRAEQLISEMEPFRKNMELLSASIEEIDINRPTVWINCTSVGMGNDEANSPIPESLINSNHYVIDFVYHPLRTQLIKDADRNDAKIITGLDMLIEQGLESFRIWFNQDPGKDIPRSRLISSLLLQ